MSLMRLSRDEVDKLLSERDAKTAELNKLQNMTWQQMWTEDLDVFERALQVRVVDLDSLESPFGPAILLDLHTPQFCRNKKIMRQRMREVCSRK